MPNSREHGMKMKGSLKKCMLQYHNMQYNEELNANNSSNLMPIKMATVKQQSLHANVTLL